MQAIARRSSSRGHSLRRRLVAGGAAVAATAALGVGLTAAPASAARYDPCSTAKRVFDHYMHEAYFWIGAADRLASVGNEEGASQASEEVNYYLDQANGALVDMSMAC